MADPGARDLPVSVCHSIWLFIMWVLGTELCSRVWTASILLAKLAGNLWLCVSVCLCVYLCSQAWGCVGTDRNPEWPGPYFRVKLKAIIAGLRQDFNYDLLLFQKGYWVVAVLKGDRPSCKGGLHPKRLWGDKEKIEGIWVRKERKDINSAEFWYIPWKSGVHMDDL